MYYEPGTSIRLSDSETNPYHSCVLYWGYGKPEEKRSDSAETAGRWFFPEDISRITTPIGLDILAETPEEIAVSIAGQLIAERAKAATR